MWHVSMLIFPPSASIKPSALSPQVSRVAKTSELEAIASWLHLLPQKAGATRTWCTDPLSTLPRFSQQGLCGSGPHVQSKTQNYSCCTCCEHGQSLEALTLPQCWRKKQNEVVALCKFGEHMVTAPWTDSGTHWSNANRVEMSWLKVLVCSDSCMCHIYLYTFSLYVCFIIMVYLVTSCYI